MSQRECRILTLLINISTANPCLNYTFTFTGHFWTNWLNFGGNVRVDYRGKVEWAAWSPSVASVWLATYDNMMSAFWLLRPKTGPHRERSPKLPLSPNNERGRSRLIQSVSFVVSVALRGLSLTSFVEPLITRNSRQSASLHRFRRLTFSSVAEQINL